MLPPPPLPGLPSLAKSPAGFGDEAPSDTNSSQIKSRPYSGTGIDASALDCPSGSRRSKTGAELTPKPWDGLPSASTRSAINWHFCRLGCK